MPEHRLASQVIHLPYGTPAASAILDDEGNLRISIQSLVKQSNVCIFYVESEPSSHG